MRLLTCTLFSLVSASLMAETVYKTVDEDGNVIFSDQPSTDAEVIELQELQTIDNPNPPRYKPTQRDEQNQDPESYYQALSIVSPRNGEAYRSNNGDLTIQLSLRPALQRGHSLIVKMDGKVVSNSKTLSVSLNNINRGTHSLSAAVQDSQDKTLISTSSSFTMLRAALGGAP